MCDFCGCGFYKSVEVILHEEEPLEAPQEVRGGEVVLAEVE